MKTRSLSMTLLSLVLAASFVGVAGCKKKPPEEPIQPAPAPAPAPAPERQPEPPPPPPPPKPAAPERPSLSTLNSQLRTIYFDFDKSDIRMDASGSLAANAELMARYADLNVMLEGHCDERGTIEYNLALGDRRAAATRQALMERGIDASRIQTISYGEERPATPGHDESSWSKNRRAEFRFVSH